jgi:hypothetical protein
LARSIAIREVPYRGDVVALNNADAEFIAAARSDVAALLAALKEARAEVRRLGSVVDEYREVIDLHHADFVKIKGLARVAIDCEYDVYDPTWALAVREIDRIVR